VWALLEIIMHESLTAAFGSIARFVLFAFAQWCHIAVFHARIGSQCPGVVQQRFAAQPMPRSCSPPCKPSRHCLQRRSHQHGVHPVDKCCSRSNQHHAGAPSCKIYFSSVRLSYIQLPPIFMSPFRCSLVLFLYLVSEVWASHPSYSCAALEFLVTRLLIDLACYGSSPLVGN